MHYLYILISGILFGGIVFGAKILSLQGVTLFEIILIPNLLGLIFTFYPAKKDFYNILKVPFKISFMLLLAMLFINIGQYTPLFLNINVSLVVLLLYLQPLWTILIEKFYFGRKVSKEEWFLIFVMLIGIVMIANPFDVHHYSILGICLALLGGVGLSFWVIISKYFTTHNISAIGTYWAISFYSVCGVLFIYLFGLNFFKEYNVLGFSFDFDSKVWSLFLLYSVFCIMIPNILLYEENRTIPAEKVGMILLIEPVIAILLDIIFLNYTLTANFVVGAALIIGANIVLILKKPASIFEYNKDRG